MLKPWTTLTHSYSDRGLLQTLLSPDNIKISQRDSNPLRSRVECDLTIILRNHDISHYNKFVVTGAAQSPHVDKVASGGTPA
jgi:hypothetical protein